MASIGTACRRTFSINVSNPKPLVVSRPSESTTTAWRHGAA
jgi:hypothetical protein